MILKNLRFDEDVLGVLRSMKWSRNGTVGKLAENIDRTLYVRVNKALEAMGGKWSRKEGGHVFATDPRSKVEGLIDSGSLTVERDGFFQTPDAVIDRMFDLIPPTGGLTLEPSAGLGAIAKRLNRETLTCVEKNPERAAELTRLGFDVICGDFLEIVIPQAFDRVYMNPPFEVGQDAVHVVHAYNHLAPGGMMVSVMGEGIFFREDKKAVYFRDWFGFVNGGSVRLPEHSFRESGTDVNTRLIWIKR